MFRFFFVFFFGEGAVVQVEDALVWEIFPVVSRVEKNLLATVFRACLVAAHFGFPQYLILAADSIIIIIIIIVSFYVVKSLIFLESNMLKVSSVKGGSV